MNAKEQELIERCLSGDRRAQNQLYNQYASHMYVVCLRYCREETLAQDVLQEGFVRVFRYLEQFRGQCPMEYWIRRIMVNTALRHLSRQKKLQENESVMEATDAQVFSQVNEESINFKSMDFEVVLKAIRELPTGFRAVFNLFAIEGYSHKEISEMLGISEGTSKSQYARARMKLQTALAHLKQELIT